MNEFHRRKFLKSLAAGGILATGSHTLAASGFDSSGPAPGNNAIVERVKMAMLSMQRASWEQGVAAQALFECDEGELVYLMAKEAALRQASDGRLSILYTDNGITDPGASGEIVWRTAEESGEEELQEANRRMLQYFLDDAPRSPEGILYHTLDSPEFWIDSMYMAPPYLCIAGYAKESMKQIEGLRRALYNEKAGLYSHRWHEGEKRYVNELFWGVGNGWALAGLARVIDDLPPGESTNRTKLIGYATVHIDSCLPYMRPDGLFHNVLDDSSTFVETNFPQMLAYTIFRGIKSGWLGSNYLEKAELMRSAAYARVDKHGFVNDVCGAPYFDKAGRATEGQAFFLLMESAYQKLQNK